MRFKFTHFIKSGFSLLVMAMVTSGCQSIPETSNQSSVIKQVIASDQTLANNTANNMSTIASKLDSQQTLSESEAVLYALNHNAAFKVLLVDLKLAKADLIEAGLLPNPALIFSFSAANKPYRYAIDFPIEALWLRPIKLRSMKREADATASRLAQSGLNLIKDVRIAYAQAVLAQERLTITESAYKLHHQIYTLSTKQLALGDINGRDVLLTENNASVAKRDWKLAQFDVTAKMDRLLYLLGASQQQRKVALHPTLAPACQADDVDRLLTQSLSQRQDVLAAAFSINAAKEKVKLSKLGWLKFLVSADATSGQVNGHTLSPSIRTDIPLFNQNQDGNSRAEAMLEKATLNLEAMKQQAALEVRTAHTQYEQTCHDWRTLEDTLIPTVKKTIQLTKHAYEEGDISYLQTLEAQRQLVDTQMREVTLKADLIAKWAELTRTTGKE